MSESSWGHCNHCKSFESPARMPLGTEEAACGHPELRRHSLRVFGASGCNLFSVRPGLAADGDQGRLRA